MKYPEKIHHWIADNDVILSGTETYLPKYNPSNGSQLGLVAEGKEHQIIFMTAVVAFENWSHTPVVKRGEILRTATQLMESRKQEIVGIVALETGKSPKDAAGETRAAIELGYFIAGEGRRFYGQTTTSAVPNRFAYTTRQPVGVCALITSFNTPIANAAWKAFPALLCGNTVIMKPSEYTPYTAIWFAKILKEAGLPIGVFSVIQGGTQTGGFLVSNKDVNLVSFTGSVATGKEIAEIASKRLARVCLELGGKNPLVVCDDADIDWAVECAVLSAFSNAGQRCASASRIIVFDSIYEKFKQKMCDKTLALKIGPTDEDDFGPVISLTQLKKVLNAVNEATSGKEILLTGGSRFFHCDYPNGYYIQPTILENIPANDPISQEELFGPITCLYRVKDLAEAIVLANNSKFGLTGAIHTSSIHRKEYFKNHYRAGVVSINGQTYGSEPHLPFGGLRDSGNGWREPGAQALDAYSEWQTVYEKYDPNLV
ncbi:MAG: aldehyde dehydrogenase [Candidatus Yanofskybacteria bacterium]|nr:aldehyde dehydrogenase [Candidatus Yanofskybacteria bacterium]